MYLYMQLVDETCRHKRMSMYGTTIRICHKSLQIGWRCIRYFHVAILYDSSMCKRVFCRIHGLKVTYSSIYHMQHVKLRVHVPIHSFQQFFYCSRFKSQVSNYFIVSMFASINRIYTPFGNVFISFFNIVDAIILLD